MTKPTPFIYQKRDGSWHINGGLVFCKQFAYSEGPVSVEDHRFWCSGSRNSASNVHVISSLPRWYQLKQWLDLLRLLRRYTAEAGTTAVEFADCDCDVIAADANDQLPTSQEH